jgi:hypothetical protein
VKIALFTTVLAALGAAGASAATLSGSTGYALGSNGTGLTVFDDLGMGSGGTTLTLSDRLNAIAYRPVTGELYGYQAGSGGGSDRVYTIDTATGMLNDTGATPGDGVGLSAGARVGFDFNNAIDAARAVSTRDGNVVFFPSNFPDERANTLLQFTDLAYAEGDANAGTNPRVFANAYTNAIDGMTAGTTLQYALDARTNSLLTLDNNAGTLNSIAQVTVDGMVFDFTRNGGLDILSESEGDNLAVALLSGNGSSGLYTIDLESGAASVFGDPLRGQYQSVAAQTGNGPASVPLPAGLPLILAGLGALGGMRVLRRA